MFGQGQTVVHDGKCTHCGASGLMPISNAVLVKRKFAWLCPSCKQVNTIRLTRDHARKLKDMFHRPGGTRISPEELLNFQQQLPWLDEAVQKEIR